MANQEQLKILKQGVEVWNEWREKNPDMEIDLIKADLRDAQLIRVNLSEANLTEAKLGNAWLGSANLRNANLEYADLEDADLKNAHLDDAHLAGAKFNDANLSDAFLIGTDLCTTSFIYAGLSGAKLNGSDLRGTDFTSANLKETNFIGAKFNSGTSFRNANLTWAHLETDLNGANFEGAKLFMTYLTGAKFPHGKLCRADLTDAYLDGADLRKADFKEANLTKTNLTKANLRGANFTGANLTETNFQDADLREVILEGADLIRTKIDNAIISNARVFGVNVWDLQGEFKEQKELNISPVEDVYYSTDNIKDAQFVSLILNNPEISVVLNTLSSKVVLILGRFSDEERKDVLNSLRNELRKNNLLPIVFDFERPEDRDFTETVKFLAGMCYFVIADITNPKSSPLELQATVPDNQIPFIPIIKMDLDKKDETGKIMDDAPFSMMQNLQTKYPWVLDTIAYKDKDQLIRILEKGIINRAKKEHNRLRDIKKRMPKLIKASEFV